MAPPSIYLETHSKNPSYNLAFEEFVLTNRREGNYLILWQNDRSVIVGLNQNTIAEVHQEFVSRHRIRVVRRATGGGAVYHDLGNLNYSFITDMEDSENMTMAHFLIPVVEALRGLGIDAQISGRNDILVEGRKVSGTAQRILHGRILHHGTLLFDTDPKMIEGALRVDNRKLVSKGISSVRSRVGNIRNYVDLSLQEFWDYLKNALSANGLCQGSLTEPELAQVRALESSKYDTWDWNFGRSPKYTLSNKRKWDGGLLEVKLAIEKGMIQSAAMYGDFLAVTSLEPVLKRLESCPFQRDRVSERLEGMDLRPYFGDISEKEILDTLFDLEKGES